MYSLVSDGSSTDSAAQPPAGRASFPVVTSITGQRSGTTLVEKHMLLLKSIRVLKVLCNNPKLAVSSSTGAFLTQITGQQIPDHPLKPIAGSMHLQNE